MKIEGNSNVFNGKNHFLIANFNVSQFSIRHLGLVSFTQVVQVDFKLVTFHFYVIPFNLHDIFYLNMVG